MTILDDIRAYKLEEIAARKMDRPQADIEGDARGAGPVRPFAEALRRTTTCGTYGLIAEIKRASPSKGLIREDFDPATLATAYESGGATCLSVLTDAPSFRGHEDYLRQAREATSLPVLRKDFMFDPWQIPESRALGADCVLVIMAAVTDAQAVELVDAASHWGMDTIVEVHSVAEAERAASLDVAICGINNRDLNTFETDTQTTRRVAKHVPADRIIVSESGLKDRQDLAQMARFGVRCFLIGETLMRADDVEGATRELLRGPWKPEAA